MSEERKVKVLCVEDEQDIRENIADILRDEDFEVFEAANGKEGFESFVRNTPDIVISDIMMPEVDGYALLEMIRGNKNIRNNTVPFIFLSALGQKDNIIKGVNSSANDYLIKPIDFDLMIAKVREKTANRIKVQEVHNRNITNIKNQVSSILPVELFNYLNIITQTIAKLKDQPYGPLPHEKYLRDFDQIHLNAMKLRSSITNSLDSSAIDNKLNVEEDIVSISRFLKEFIGSLSSKFSSRIEFNPQSQEELLPRVKLDRLVLLEALRKVFAGMFKSDAKATVTVSIMLDPIDQMVIIFYLNSDLEKINLRSNIDESQIGKILDNQSCRFEIVEHKNNTAVLTIPSHRLITQA